MKKRNLTLTIDETVIKNAKVRAIFENTLLSKVVEEFLIEYSSKFDINEAEKKDKH